MIFTDNVVLILRCMWCNSCRQMPPMAMSLTCLQLPGWISLTICLSWTPWGSRPCTAWVWPPGTQPAACRPCWRCSTWTLTCPGLPASPGLPSLSAFSSCHSTSWTGKTLSISEITAQNWRGLRKDIKMLKLLATRL